MQEISVTDLIEPIRQRLEERTTAAEMQLCIESAEATSMVVADPAAVEQILYNLVDNACKYADGAIDRRVLISTGGNYKYVRICVRDFGPGFGEKRRRFAAFSISAEEAARRNKPGVGLGLELSRQLAQAMGGKVQVESGSAQAAMVSLLLRRGKD